MKKILATSLVILAAYSSSAFAAGPVAPPKILVIDRTGILTQSKVAQDVARQIKAYSDQTKADLNAQARALEAQGQALSQQVAILAPDVKAQKLKDFQAKETLLQAQADRKQQMIQYSQSVAIQTIAKAVEPIVKQLMQERGANLVLDHSAVVSGTDNSMDITQATIDRLNQKLSSLKVNMTAPPTGAAPR